MILSADPQVGPIAEYHTAVPTPVMYMPALVSPDMMMADAQLRERAFIEAARASSINDWGIITTHLIPNTATTVIVYFTYDLARLVLLEASLAFLGFGVQPPTPSWGALIADSREYIADAPWASLVPGVAVVLVVAAFNFVGDGLRDLADPKTAVAQIRKQRAPSQPIQLDVAPLLDGGGTHR